MENGNKGAVIYLVGLGLVLILAGGSFMYLMGKSYSRAKNMHGWPKKETLILRSELEERKIGPAVQIEYRHGLLYGYEYEGKSYESERLTLRGNPWTKKLREVEKTLEKFPEKSVQTCYVNPIDPEVAVLKPDTKAPGYSIWFPAIFVLGGVGMIIGAIKSLNGGSKAEPII